MGRELFKTSGEGRNKDIDTYAPNETINHFLDKFYKKRLKGVQSCGFKVMLDQLDKNPEILTYIKKNKIICLYLERNNILNTAISRLLARERQIYHTDKNITFEPENINANALLEELNILNQIQKKLHEIVANLDVKTIYYEDLIENKDIILNDLLNYLDISNNFILNSTLQKLNSNDLKQVIKNYDEIESILKNTKFKHFLPKKTIYKDFNDTNKVLFIHIPKVAGSSIEKSLFGTKGSVGHYKAIDFIKDDPEKFQNYYTFAFTRHPLDRFVSAYEYLRQGGRNKYDKAWADEYLLVHDSFKSFVLSLNNETQRKQILSWMHFQPQYLFVCDESKKILVDFVGKYENIENDFIFITKQLSFDTVLPHENKTAQRTNYHQYYDEETLQIIYSIYQIDFELFNYTVS